ncbi:DNA phosphorothioation-dependent restriction protein DptG [Intestinibacter bartlettii]|uniref:DNA phosphorothioation-dependent restriction protein DptG n=1 Tax=Intestinibacter bartlettii TaxID=261299 RepID=UPI002901E6B5|nr:DNA phosphorothioation-dependent restriction protein DptG [Intestinibacter bartlettii]MDU2164145.1 DNA phosphorothioation-dependent restriction protein DptG [Intestinibacter bartlettii]
MYDSNIQELKKSLSMTNEGIKHKIGVKSKFFPFTTNERYVINQKETSGTVAELVRLINGKQLDATEINIDEIIKKIMSLVQIEDENDEGYLYEIIKEQIMNEDGSRNIFHYKLYNYINSNKKEQKIAKFLYDIVFKNMDYFNEIYNEIQDEDVITKLILEGMDQADYLIDKRLNKNEDVYENKLTFITKLAYEDFKFLSTNKEFFLEYFERLVYFYYFYYLIQLCIKINKRFNVDYNKVEETYYLLDWEKAGKNRKSTLKGYKDIRSRGEDLWVNLNVIEHSNFLMGTENYNLVEIEEYFKSLEEDKKKEYLETLKEWIKEYKICTQQEYNDIELDFNILMNEIIKSVSVKLSEPGRGRRLFNNVEEIGKLYFLKSRGGSYGYMFNLTQETVLMLTAICVKEEKITLKALFEEYNKRGVFLDKESKELVVKFLEKLNLIDKKSDSGDAQYVKSIL